MNSFQSPNFQQTLKILIASGIAGLLALSACAPSATPAPKPTEAAKPAAPGAPVQSAPAYPAATAAPAAPAARPNTSSAAPAPMSTAAPYIGSQPQPGPRPIAGEVANPAGRAPIEPTSIANAPRPTPFDTTFKDYGVNPFVDPRKDRLSTFALDTDTASYSVMRNYVQRGALPPYQAVRAEEFINYFKQDYAPPTNRGFAIYADGAVSPMHNDGTILVRYGVQGYEVPESQRKTAALTLVIDISGSMNMDKRLGLAKRSLQLLVDKLRPDDKVAIAVFGSTARTVLGPTSAGEKEAILAAIYGLKSEGATNTEAGLKLGYELATRMYIPNGINRVMVLSDGEGNVGITDPIKIINMVKGSAPADIALSTFGFGVSNYNDVMMEQLANKGNGAYAYIDTLDEARRLFVDHSTSTLELIAKDARVQIEFNPEVVSAYRLIGYENRAIADQDFRNDSVTAAGMNAGHNATAIYALQLRPNARGKISTVFLRWQDPNTRQTREISGDFNTNDLANSFEQTSPRYQMNVVVAQFAEILRHSPYTNVSLSQLSNYADMIARALPNDKDVQEFTALVNQASRIR